MLGAEEAAAESAAEEKQYRTSRSGQGRLRAGPAHDGERVHGAHCQAIVERLTDGSGLCLG